MIKGHRHGALASAMLLALLASGCVVGLPRRDVEIHHEPESWAVEARQGGPVRIE